MFIAHGKNRTPLDQLKKALDQFKVKYAVAIDVPDRGRPISKKVADLMASECSSGFFIFAADERFLREDEEGDAVEVWRPSENVMFELGAASILYPKRLLRPRRPRVRQDQLVAEIGDLFGDLVALDVLEVRSTG